MNYEDSDTAIIATCVAVVLVVVSGFSSYKLGRYLERKEFVKFFVAATEKTYNEGFYDGVEHVLSDIRRKSRT
jgi:hypothetical protein